MICYGCGTTITKVLFNLTELVSLWTFLVFQCFSLNIPALNHDDDDHEGPTLQALSPNTEIDLSTLENDYLDDKQITSVEIELKKDLT